MKNHMKVVFCILAIALFAGIIRWGADKLKKQEKPSVTPTPTPATNTVTPTMTPTLIPTATSTPKPTGIPSPTVEATPSPSPEPTPDPYHEKDGSLTAEGAVAELKTVSADLLGLEKDIDAYQMEVDEWTTVVQAKDCYCINVLTEEGYTAAIFYVSVDGSRIYSLDEEGTFNPIRKE